MTEDIRMIHGDCLSVMAGMEPGSVDAVVTDPPFGVRPESWDDMDAQEFARFTMGWLSQARRIAPELIVFCNQDSVTYDLCCLLYKRARRIIWSKPPGSQLAGGRECGMWYSYECILHCHARETWSVVEPKSLEVAGQIKKAREAAGLSRSAIDIALRGKKTGLCFRWEEAACLPTKEQADKLCDLLPLNGSFHDALSDAYRSRDDTKAKAADMASEHAAEFFDVLTHRTVTKGRHPCEKPLSLMTELLTSIGAEYKSILDPFAGSGSTLVACQKTGRRCIGIDINPKYVEIARRRVRDNATPLLEAMETEA